MGWGWAVMAGRVISLCKGPVAERAYFIQELKDKCYGWNREGREWVVVCKVRLGPEDLLNQKRELDFIMRAWEALGGFLERHDEIQRCSHHRKTQHHRLQDQG